MKNAITYSDIKMFADDILIPGLHVHARVVYCMAMYADRKI